MNRKGGNAMEPIFLGLFSFTALFSLMSVFSLVIVFVFIKQKKYWHLPGSILLVITFALFVRDEVTGSAVGQYALAGVIFISVIESVIELHSLTREPAVTEGRKQTRNVNLIWGYFWMFLKLLLIYFILTAK